MASAVLPRLNEPYCGEHKPALMRKYSTAATTTTNNHQPLIHNPNPNFDLSRQMNSRFGNGSHFDRHSPSPQDQPSTAPGGEGYGGYSTLNLAQYSRRDLKKLKKRLVSELEQVRSLQSWIKSAELGLRPVNPVQRGNVKKNQNPNSKLAGSKRVNPVGVVHDPKRVAGLNEPMEKLNLGIMKKCGQILGKLKKHKFGWIFSLPVDVEGLGLRDYYQVIKRPMDLGTVEVNLNSGVYGSALDFASDVKLTFSNAMKYNPKGHDVHMMAEKLLKIFNDLFEPAYLKFEKDTRKVLAKGEPKQICLYQEPMQVDDGGFKRGSVMCSDDLAVARMSSADTVAVARKSSIDDVPAAQISVADNVPVARKSNTDNVAIAKKSDTLRGESVVSSQFPTAPAPPVQSSKSMVTPRKLPKPKAKDPNKREMTSEEKARLGINLEELPEEKMVQLLQIIGKKNQELLQCGDEIELDIEAVDTETLWELDRFVTNYKKMISKIRRQGLIQNQAASDQPNRSPVSEANEAPQMSKKADAGEEDIDIGEDMPMSSFPPVEIEKDVTAAASSGCSSRSSSSSSDSSSSDSDSESSSGSDSDADSVQSPFIESKQGNGVSMA